MTHEAHLRALRRIAVRVTTLRRRLGPSCGVRAAAPASFPSAPLALRSPTWLAPPAASCEHRSGSGSCSAARSSTSMIGGVSTSRRTSPSTISGSRRVDRRRLRLARRDADSLRLGGVDRFPFHGLHHVALEEAHDALSIALHPEQAFTLAGAQQIVQAGESVLALVERQIDAAQELLHLTDVHRPSRRILRRLEQAANLADAVGQRAAPGAGASSRGGCGR